MPTELLDIKFILMAGNLQSTEFVPQFVGFVSRNLNMVFHVYYLYY